MKYIYIEKDTKDFKDRIEKRIEFFEDTWSSEEKLVELYGNIIADNFDVLKQGLESQFNESFAEFKDKIENMQNDLDNWKSSNLEAITDTLDNVKDIASDNADYSEIKSMIETVLINVGSTPHSSLPSLIW